MVKRNWTCSVCLLVFSRRWNLERHVQLMHGINKHPKNLHSVPSQRENNKNFFDDEMFNPPLFGLKENFKEVHDFVEMQNKMTNSTQAFNQINSLNSQVTSLQQQVTSYYRQLSDLHAYNWLLPKALVQGISGYLCENCKSFSLKPIFDLGYDMTMKSKHRCNNMQLKNSYPTFPIPPDIPNIDYWAGKVLSDYVSLHPYIGKCLFTRDLTKATKTFREELDIESDNTVLGIPDRFSLYRVNKKNYTLWMDRAIQNLGTRIAMADVEVMEFLTKVKSTYAIFEIQIGPDIRRIFMALTY